MTKISDASLVAAATDNMQMPTGEAGDKAVSVGQIKNNVISATNSLYDAAGAAAAAQATAIASANAYTDTGLAGKENTLGYTPRRVFYKNNNPSSLNNTTNETLMDSVLIPANTLQANDILQIYVLMTKSGTAGNVVIRVNVNTSASLIGDTLIGTFTASTTGLWAPLLRKMIFQNSVTSQSIYSTGTSSINDELNPNSAHTALTIDFTQNQYFTVSFQNGNIGDTTTLRSWFIEIIRT